MINLKKYPYLIVLIFILFFSINTKASNEQFFYFANIDKNSLKTDKSSSIQNLKYTSDELDKIYKDIPNNKIRFHTIEKDAYIDGLYFKQEFTIILYNDGSFHEILDIISGTISVINDTKYIMYTNNKNITNNNNNINNSTNGFSIKLLEDGNINFGYFGTININTKYIKNKKDIDNLINMKFYNSSVNTHTKSITNYGIININNLKLQ